MNTLLGTLPQSTLSKVDDFIVSQMKISSRKEGIGSKNVPRFAVDGYGRWREVGGKRNSIDQDSYKNYPTLDVYKRLLAADSEGTGFSVSKLSPTFSQAGRGESHQETSRLSNDQTSSTTNYSVKSYKHLSSSLRSNVFPGTGKGQWESSTKTTHTVQSIPSSWTEPNEHHCITKDAYMVWAEHDVHRQRLKKAWDKYIAEAPKHERKGTQELR